MQQTSVQTYKNDQKKTGREEAMKVSPNPKWGCLQTKDEGGGETDDGNLEGRKNPVKGTFNRVLRRSGKKSPTQRGKDT